MWTSTITIQQSTFINPYAGRARLKKCVLSSALSDKCQICVNLRLKITGTMPKVKTNSSAKKRFTITGSGKIKRRKAFKRHILTKKGTEQKKRLGKPTIVKKCDEKRVRLMLNI